MGDLRCNQKKILIAVCVSCLLLVNSLQAYVASSTNYRIERDSINFAGGLSTSSSYSLEDTLGEVATGVASSTNYQIKAGYQQMGDVFISISSPTDITLSPSISGISGGQAAGSATWTVITDNTAGYNLFIHSSTDPAMKSSNDSFANYNTVGPNPDYTWAVSLSASAFGFTVDGVNLVTRYLNNGSSCNAGSLDSSGICWDGVPTSDRLINHSASANHPSGATTTVEFKAEVGLNKLQSAGAYQAVITLTAVAL